MITLYTKDEFSNSKSNDKLPLQCYSCCQVFYAIKKDIQKSIKHNKPKKYCSVECFSKTRNLKQDVRCKQCDKTFKKADYEIKKSKNNFCSRSCGAIYNNANKIHGTKRSKLESYLEGQLLFLYPDLKIDFNKKDTINSELDIYIPSLKLAFELNGIFHYEPIFGNEKLNQTQNNDHRKFQACAEHRISLCVIDTSMQKKFKDTTSQKFLDIIIDIINNKTKNTLTS